MKVMAFIAARMDSTRFPGKTLAHLRDKPLLWYVIEVAKRIEGVDEIAVLTSILEVDDAIAEYCEKNDVKYFRGSNENVFERFRDAAETFHPDVIIRLTGDNPFMDSKIAEMALKLHIESNADFTSTREMDGEKMKKRYAPSGFSVDIFNSNLLFDADIDNLTEAEKEHIIPYFFNRKEKIQISYLDLGISQDDVKKHFGIDKRENLDFAEEILNHINWENFTYKDVLSVERSQNA